MIVYNVHTFLHMCWMCTHFLKLYKLSACTFTHTHTNRGVHSLHKSAWTTCPIKSFPSPGWASDCKAEGWWLKEIINTRSNKVIWHNGNYGGKEPSQMIVEPLKSMWMKGNLFAKLGLVSPPYNRPNKVIWHNGSYVSVGKEPPQMIVDPLKNMCMNGNLFA